MIMKRKNQINRFWKPGSSTFQNELAKQETDLIAPLKSELKETSDAQRKAQLKQEIAAIKAEFRTKRKNARYGLFGKT